METNLYNVALMPFQNDMCRAAGEVPDIGAMIGGASRQKSPIRAPSQVVKVRVACAKRRKRLIRVGIQNLDLRSAPHRHTVTARTGADSARRLLAGEFSHLLAARQLVPPQT